MPRPRKGDAEKLVPASTGLRPADYDRLFALAQRRGVAVAVVLRDVVTGFLNCKTPEVPRSS